MKTLLLIPIIFYLSGCVNPDQNDTSNGNDFCQILQLTIDLPELQQYFHVEKIPGRSPLRIAINDSNASCDSLMKFGEKVILFDKNVTHSPLFPILEISEINITVNLTTINFKYSPEGVKANAQFKKNEGKWALYNADIVEI